VSAAPAAIRRPSAGRWLYRLSPLLLLFLLIIIWWVATEFFLTRQRVYPGPFDVLAYLDRAILRGDTGHGPTLANITATLFRLVVAWTGSMIIGTFLGILAGRSRFFFDYFENLVWVFMATPSM